MVGEFAIHKDNIGSNGLIQLVDEPAADALKGGKHRLVIDPSQLGSLASALKNQNYELIQAAADPGVAKFHRTYDFAGYYQESSGTHSVLRTGSKTKDTVTIDPNDQLNWTSEDIHPEESKQFAAPTDILIVTADKKDKIHTLGDGDQKTDTKLVILAGLHPDTIIGGRGHDYLDAGRDTFAENEGVISFNLVVGMQGSDELIGSDATDVMFGDGFVLGIDATTGWAFDLSEGKISTPTAGLVPIGQGEDKLFGNDGFDFLIGGEGKDTLESGKGFGGFLLGDTFEWSAGGTINLKPLYDSAKNFTLFDNATIDVFVSEVINTGVQIADFLGLPEFKGDGDDVLKGRATFDFFYGGKGNDTIDASSSAMAIGFGGEGPDQITTAKWLSLFWGDDLLPDDVSSQACNDCNDTINMVPHSLLNIVVAGEGDDNVKGGGVVDIVIGDGVTGGLVNWMKWSNDLEKGKFKPPVGITTGGTGNDTIDGNYSQGLDFSTKGLDIIIGGAGNDTITGAGFLVGPGIMVTPTIQLDLADIFGKSKSGASQATNDDVKKATSKAKVLDFNGFEYVSTFTEQDTITGVGPLDIIAGSKGPDTLISKGWYAWIDGKDGNDTIDTRQAVGAWIEGGKHDDTIYGPALSQELGGVGSVIFGDEFSAVNPSNPVPSVSLGIDVSWGKWFKFDASASMLRMTGEGKDTIHTGTGLINVAFGGSGEDTIYGEGYLNILVGDEFNVAAGVKFDANFETQSYKWQFDLPGLHGDFKDKLYGTRNSIDIIFGGGGDDTIEGNGSGLPGGGLDALFGNDGQDTITGDSGPNLIVGGDGNDILTGGNFANFIFGDSYYRGSG